MPLIGNHLVIDKLYKFIDFFPQIAGSFLCFGRKHLINAVYITSFCVFYQPCNGVFRRNKIIFSILEQIGTAPIRTTEKETAGEGERKQGGHHRRQQPPPGVWLLRVLLQSFLPPSITHLFSRLWLTKKHPEVGACSAICCFLLSSHLKSVQNCLDKYKRSQNIHKNLDAHQYYN